MTDQKTLKLDRIIHYITDVNRKTPSRSEMMRLFHIRTAELPEILNALKEKGIELK